MEEIEYKLKKKNSPISIVNAISKLIDTIQIKADSGHVTELVEFKLLKSKCEDEDSILSITACQGLVTLVETGVLGVLPTLSGFIAALSTARNFTGIIPAIGSLLILDLKFRLSNNEVYKCPFTLRSPQHPFITILKQKKEVWLDVFNQIQFMCQHKEDIVANNSVELLRPVLLFILCDPCQTRDLPLTCCRQTWALVLHLLQYPQFKEFIIDAQSWVQVELDNSVMDNSWMLLDLAHASIDKGDLELCSSLALAPFVASAIHRLTTLGHDTRCWLSLLTTLTERNPESASCVLMLLADTVTNCPAIYLKDLLNTCAVILEQKSSNVIAAKMLACSALQWLLYPSHTTAESLGVASSLLTAIDNTTSWGNHTARLCTNKVFAQLRSMDERVDFSIEMCKLVETWQNNPSSLLPYLSRISSSPPSFLEKLRLFLSAIFVDNFNTNEVKEKSLQLLLLLVRRNNELATSIVTLILYKLASEHQPHIQLELLRGLTAMAVQKENIALVVHSLESVRLKSSLKTLSVDLYLRLWKVECRCYPYLQKLLLEPASNERNDQTWEFEVARAVAISDICKTRPELYGEELVILLSQILNNCGDTWGSLPSSIALQGITSLCKAGIADIASTWRALAPKLSRDKRTAVVVSLCEFFAAIPSLHTPSIDYEKLVIEASTKLWMYVSTSNQLEVITAALRQKLKLPSSYAKTPVDAARRPEDVLPYIPGECWIQLLHQYTGLSMMGRARFISQSYVSAGYSFYIDMLTCWIKVELTVYHSGMYQITGRGEPANYNHLHDRSICQAVTNYLCNQTQGISQDVTRQCFRIISQSFTKPLPPLNWSFLQKFLDKSSEIRMHCLVVAARQAKISPSARRFIGGISW
uniref:(California timema) hypothetical protein n=1 Tax=Timema californicum TaxID=61474 RepID=A0A7R9IX61_TIMCA|nr:unnamed protein product [Timema californicum]